MAKGWVATDRAGLGDWVLRSAGGFTGRANSALVVGDPSLPVDKAIDYVERWYAERDAAPLFQLPGEPGFAVADLPAGAALLERGYVAGGGRADWTTGARHDRAGLGRAAADDRVGTGHGRRRARARVADGLRPQPRRSCPA